MWIVFILLAALLVAITVYDLTQNKRAIIKNFPIIGHFRYWIEAIGPELRQYIVTNNDEERPFSRDQRTWVYSSAKKENNYFGFGTDNNLDAANGYLIVKQTTFPINEPHKGEPGYDPGYNLPCAKVLGAARGRAKAFRPNSIINVSAMSFGSLSSAAIEALNRGAALCNCMHNTGEGGLSPYHQKGGDVILQLGTAYFGCRDAQGHFSVDALQKLIEGYPQVRAIEIKLSQGAKPAKGGILPGAKVTPEIAKIRGIEVGKDCLSPASHREFHDVDSMLDFIERVATATGLPVGIKSAVGQLDFWEELAGAMETGERGVDFITIDGGEGGTGAAPLVFSDHVALPFRLGMSRVYPIFARRGLAEKIVFIGGGRLGFPDSAMLAMALGCDMIAVAREAMLAIGCIQAQRCHTGHCPAGVATQNRWLIRGLDPTLKAARLANYMMTFRKEMLQLSYACGVRHPALVEPKHLELIFDGSRSIPVHEHHGYDEHWKQLDPEDAKALEALMLAMPANLHAPTAT